MALTLNIRHLRQSAIRFDGRLSVTDLDLGSIDELLTVTSPLTYDFEAEQHEQGILLQGRLEISLRAECARCLQAFPVTVALNNWARLLCWEGEDCVQLRNDCVDLTPYLREDILLALPQRPLCRPECAGLPGRPAASTDHPGGVTASREPSSAWDALDQLGL